MATKYSKTSQTDFSNPVAVKREFERIMKDNNSLTNRLNALEGTKAPATSATKDFKQEITSPDGSINVENNKKIEVWNYQEKVENRFIPNPEGYDWYPYTTYIASSTGSSYTIIYITSKWYYCRTDHISSNSFVNDLALGYWTEIQLWSTGINYIINDLVYFSAGYLLSEICIYRCITGHLSDLTNYPMNLVTWYWDYVTLNNTYYVEIANRSLPLRRSSGFNNIVDVANINGDGWIPFFYYYNQNIIRGTDKIISTDFNWIKKSSMNTQYEHPDFFGGLNRSMPFNYFKPDKVGVYLINCSIKIRAHIYSIYTNQPHFMSAKGMLILDKWNPSFWPALWSGSDFPIEYYNPIVYRTLITDPDIRHENDIYEILDRKTFYKNYYLDETYINPSPSPWTITTIYNIGDEVVRILSEGLTNFVYKCKVGHTSDNLNKPPNPKYWYYYGKSSGWELGGNEDSISKLVDIQLQGRTLVYCSNINECYVPLYKLYLYFINLWQTPPDPYINLRDAVYSGGVFKLDPFIRVYNMHNLIEASYIGHDFTSVSNSEVYKIARCF